MCWFLCRQQNHFFKLKSDVDRFSNDLEDDEDAKEVLKTESHVFTSKLGSKPSTFKSSKYDTDGEEEDDMEEYLQNVKTKFNLVLNDTLTQMDQSKHPITPKRSREVPLDQNNMKIITTRIQK